MANEINFIPRKQGDVAVYGAQVQAALMAEGFDPATMDLTDADVAEVAAAVAAHQSALDGNNALKLAMRGQTKLLSGRNGTHAKLTAVLRRVGNKARFSSAPADALAGIGVKRRDAKPTPRGAPGEAPEFMITASSPGVLSVSFRVGGSNRPRARATNATGVEIAVVDAAQPAVRGEADRVPTRFVSRTPAELDTSGMPAKARLYSRWVTLKGEHGPWSLPVPVSVI